MFEISSERMLPKFLLPCVVLFFLMLCTFSCQQEYTPKPMAYPRLELPKKAYENYFNPDCPFQFKKPVYATVDHNPSITHKQSNDRCWMDLDFQTIGAKMHLSYKAVASIEGLAQLIEDDYKLTAKHMKKAEYIDKRAIATANGVYGLFADVGGNAASHMQFFVTDSSRHFLRGSLYFNSTPNFDSIRPAIQFIKTDILEMIDSFEWKAD